VTALATPSGEDNSAAAEAWPPADATPVDSAALYAKLADRGFEYGPAFRGLRAVWSADNETYADVAIDAELAAQADPFLLHPALFDSALHAALVPTLDGAEGVFVPYILRGVRLYAPGAQAMRVRLTHNDNNVVSLSAVDGAGSPVASVESLAVRAITSEQLKAAGCSGQLLRLEWRRIPLLPEAAPAQGWALLGSDRLGLTSAVQTAARNAVLYQSLRSLDVGLRDGKPVPSVVVVTCAAESDGAPAVRSEVQRALVLLQEWLADDRLADSRLVFVTRGAVAARDERVRDRAGAAVWGLVRSAQSEHPGRFALVDIEDLQTCAPVFVAALNAAEPQLAVRRGALLRPRLTRCPSAPRRAGSWNADGTVMITGGTGALGRLLARHLVRNYGVRHLLLLSRRGSAAPGTAELMAELAELGADVTVEAADAGSRAQMQDVLAAIPAGRPLTLILHAAGVVADSTVSALTPRKLERVLQPKVDAALNLHELTEHSPDCELVLFSSVSGLLGGAGQANYAAANAFLDALAYQRRAAGLRGMSLAWGLWNGSDGMAEAIAPADLNRMARAGIAVLSAEEGLALFDAALGRAEPVLVPVRLSEAGLGGGPEKLPDMLADLAAVRTRANENAATEADGSAKLTEILAQCTDADREQAAVEFVCAQVAAVLQYGDARDIDPNRELSEIGFDSLTNLELSRRLAVTTGMRLPATLSFDYPTPEELARYLVKLLR
jgi:NADP-dependent 3-hydroxy acid dehydrogenase YdfG/acyl carrier protein